MNTFEQAKRYVSSIPPSISGQEGHSQALKTARALKQGFDLPDSEAMLIFQEWNQTCSPPWSQRELDHKLNEADTKDYGKPRGYLLKGSNVRHYTPVNHKNNGNGNGKHHARPTELICGSYDLENDLPEFPDFFYNGFSLVLRKCFKPGDGVRVMLGLTENGLVGCDSRGGAVLTREEWLAKLNEYPDINGTYNRHGGPPPGVYLGINPMKLDGHGRDEDVTDFRYALLEFDKLSLEAQWTLYVKSNLPCAAVIFSGRRSLHAWVKIDAKDIHEYRERVDMLYNHFAPYCPDPKNKNPSRFSRCPDAKRNDNIQRLWALHIGAPSFVQWSRELIAKGIGITYTQDTIINYQPEEDGLTLAGHRWLRKTGSCILAGPSGIGKSSLGRQLAISWALGRECFGVKPTKPIKILMIQAENDMADLHDMDVGIYQGLGILEDERAKVIVGKNLVTNHNVADTGYAFIESLQQLVLHHLPDLVILDPLLSFIGADISRQEVVGEFCRNWLNPILASANVGLLAIHHTGKPPKDLTPTKRTQPSVKTTSELAYGMMGSSELTNWARAVMILNQTQDNYELVFAKRGKRAEARHPNGMQTDTVFLQHSRDGIYWVQKDPPEEPVSASKEEKDIRVKPYTALLQANLHEFLVALPKDGLRYNDLVPKLEEYAANNLGIDIRGSSTGRVIEKLTETHKVARKGKVYIKGPDA